MILNPALPPGISNPLMGRIGQPQGVKEPFLVFHKDKVVLKPKASFALTVVSFFLLKQDILIPSFLLNS